MKKRLRILRNAARCNACGDEIESKHRHDWVQCGCGQTFVDGGLDYLRRGYGEQGYEELSEHSQTSGAPIFGPEGKLEK